MRLLNGLIGNDDNDNLYNSLGHRCKELSELNLHNYILFLGDNVALGLDQPIEKTYPSLCSKLLKMDYYNLAIFNGGVDCFKFNLLTWLKKFDKTPPRIIVVGFEFLNSMLVSNPNYDYLNTADFDQEDVKGLYHFANLSGFFNGRNLLNENLILRNVNIPIYQLSFKDKTKLFSKVVCDVNVDGSIFDYENIAYTLVQKYKSTNLSIKP